MVQLAYIIHVASLFHKIGIVGAQGASPFPYEPFPVSDIVNALVGYDVIIGDAFSSPDPGFKSQIFNAWKQTNNGTSMLGDSISAAYSNYNCKKESAVVYNFNDFSKIRNASHSFSAGAEKSAPTSRSSPLKFSELASSYYLSRPEGKDILKFFTETNGEIFITSRQCVTHTVRLSGLQAPSFTKAFQEGVIAMYKDAKTYQSDPDNPDLDKSFFKFIDTFGTHYLKVTHLGNRILLQKKFSRKSINFKEENQRQKCVDRFVQDNIEQHVSDLLTLDEDMESCDKNSETERFYSEHRVQPGKSIVSGKLRRNYESRLAVNTMASLPINFELEKISSLFQESMLGFYQEWDSSDSLDYNLAGPGFGDVNEPNKMNSSVLTTFFEDKLSQYCEVMIGKDKCDFEDKGCGFNNYCKSDEKCLDYQHLPKKHRCLPNFGECRARFALRKYNLDNIYDYNGC